MLVDVSLIEILYLILQYPILILYTINFIKRPKTKNVKCCSLLVLGVEDVFPFQASFALFSSGGPENNILPFSGWLHHCFAVSMVGVIVIMLGLVWTTNIFVWLHSPLQEGKGNW